MKLLLREHIPLFIIYLIQLLLTLFIYWLEGFRNVTTALYAFLLSTCLLIGYLAYRYMSNRTFYRRLSEPLESLDESVTAKGYAPLSEALGDLLDTQYRHYQNGLDQYRRKLNDHITFINQWVHQMKTPLSVIHLTIQEEDDPIFDSIRDETNRIQNGLQTILYTSRLNTFEHDFHVERVSLSKVVSNVVSDNKHLFIRNRVYPEVNMNEPLQVETDEKWLYFMLGQLVTNAVRYSAGKGDKVMITSFIRGHHTVLQVKDRGAGIPKQDMRRVFEPYYTGENGRQFKESTGMGLYLVREICNRLNHRVELESEVGEGTTVRLLFQR